jgi:hypothetical protein
LTLVILADIHGSLPVLEAIFADMHQQGRDGVIVASDLIRGPDDNAVIRLLQSVPTWIIRGNSTSPCCSWLPVKCRRGDTVSSSTPLCAGVWIIWMAARWPT